ncbi:MAG: hypothetical protein LBS38_00240 [Endomicrobium sp.]|jgi:hypothetical protein|nr:hypothetical protein [Endomicrobium sp.]
MTIINEITKTFKSAFGFSEDNAESSSKSSFWQNQLLGASKIEENWHQKVTEYYRLFKAADSDITFSANFQNLNYPPTVVASKLKKDISSCPARFNIFFSNTQTLKSILLPQMPQVSLRRRFDDAEISLKTKDFYETISDIVERTIEFYSEDFQTEEFCNFKYDYLIAGRGVIWLSYISTTDNIGNISDIKINFEHVNFDDFLMSPQRQWKDVWWVARRKYYSKDEFKLRFKEVDISKISFTSRIQNGEFKSIEEAAVWEIWDKRKKKVILFTPNYPELLDEIDDPYNLTNFFPTPKPLYSIYTPLNLIPTPELDEYINQFMELSVTSSRISNIVDKIRPKAFYDKTYSSQIDTLLKTDDNEYVPIDGIVVNQGSSLFLFAPLKEKQEVVSGLSAHERKIINEIYEITGISDIMRNVSSTETATMTNQRTRFGTARLQDRQSEVNAYFKNIYKIAAELVCEFGNAETFQRITNTNLPSRQDIESQNQNIRTKINDHNKIKEFVNEYNRDSGSLSILEDLKREYDALFEEQRRIENQFSWDDILTYLKQKKLIEFLIDVETDFTIENTRYEQQQQRLEVFNLLTKNVQDLLPVLQAAPSFSKILTRLFTFAMDSFKLTKSQRIELDEAIASIDTDVKSEVADAPNPDLIKAQAELMTAQARQKEAEVAAIRAQEELLIEREKLSKSSQQKLIELRLENQKNMHEEVIAKSKMETEKILADVKQKEALIRAQVEAGKSENDLDISKDKLAGHYLNKSVENSVLPIQNPEGQ